MTDEENRSDIAKLYQKKSKLRELVLQCDWKKDGKMLLGGKMVEYISASKVARNFAPLLVKVGLEIETRFGEPVRHPPIGQKGEEHWTVPFMVSYVDIDTGVSTPVSIYYGESVDPRDKGLKKASTDARKLWLITDFNIEEGIDPELSGAEGTFTPKSEEEEVEIKTQIAAIAVKPKVPVPPVKKPEPEPEVKETIVTEVVNDTATVSDDVPAVEPEKPKKTPIPRKKKVAEEPAPEVPAKEPQEDPNYIVPGMNTEYGAKITEVQKKPLVSALNKWAMAVRAGEVPEEKYEEVKEAYKNIDSNAAVIKFLTTYREVKE